MLVSRIVYKEQNHRSGPIRAFLAPLNYTKNNNKKEKEEKKSWEFMGGREEKRWGHFSQIFLFFEGVELRGNIQFFSLK